VALTGAGATFPYPIYGKWFDAYAKSTGIRINYQSIGSGGGIRQFTEGTVDFGATDGPMTDEQMAAVQGNVLHVPTVLGADVIAYNLPELGVDGEALAGIFLGAITKWNDPKLKGLNPGLPLPDKDIIVVHRSDGSGTTYVFTDYLSHISAEWKSKVGTATSVKWPIGLGGKGNEGVTQQIKQTEGSLGYVELIYAVSNGLAYANERAVPAGHGFPGVDRERPGGGGLPDRVVHLAAHQEGEPGRRQGEADQGFHQVDAGAGGAEDGHGAPLCPAAGKAHRADPDADAVRGDCRGGRPGAVRVTHCHSTHWTGCPKAWFAAVHGRS
jgi:hypothetical protein